mmetsp:Transcript_3074/g.9385  ORF Transcript_3074/g.9385 Transcript_3074/m.9385 type:complete len:158 (-) Transcript_3074:63-536(-)
MSPPYSAGRRAKEAGVSAEMDRYNFGGALTRNLVMEGWEEDVMKFIEMAENMLRDIMHRHGMLDASHGEPPQVPVYDDAQQKSHVRVAVDGEEQYVTVDKDLGPVWEHDAHYRSHGPDGDGKYMGKVWAYMSSTEREVALVMTAKRISKMKVQHGLG